MSKLQYFVLIAVSEIFGCFAESDDVLRAVVVLYRHGDRSPLSSWPNDDYFNDTSLWPDGYGQLNNFGKERHYRLGQWLRERYDGFLPARYNRNDIYIRSTDVDRTLMSAQSNLAGLYPPVGDQIWNNDIHWQAIPVHTIPENLDEIVAAAIPCPKHDRLKKELLKSEEFQQLNLENAELYHNISQLTGYDEKSVDLDTFSGLFSTITIYKGFNLSLPEWTDYYWPEIKSLAAKHFQVSTYTTELARLRTGPFYSYFINFTESVIAQGPFIAEGLDYSPKFLVVSAHDTTVADLTNSIGVFPDAVPEFASTIIWEIKNRLNNSNDLYLNVFFKNSTGLSPLTIPGCDFDCSFEDFLTIMQPIAITPEQKQLECYEQLS
ncbi:testicular acid phosphatase homolog [Rhynchophorus ferrugineus]|uniref:acid phosphatase n=1 Tax=Rhynchophorus ferrugineus TaxID=354439 RepID=A0A834IRE2_RHYFE|nr:hypothetical protein GWI33_023289 [Rhynchophorus ferrugineus]